jgi:molybdopterin molybdotransferase
LLGKCDILILTGGVSMGKLDFVPEVLAGLGIRPRFHKIKHKPGKPFWFGAGQDGLPVFALPGNPASVLVCLYRYVLPAIRKAMGGNTATPLLAMLDQSISAPGNLTHFRPAKISPLPDGRLQASMVVHQGSGDFSGWAQSDGFLELPAGETPLAAGTAVRFWSWLT